MTGQWCNSVLPPSECLVRVSGLESSKELTSMKMRGWHCCGSLQNDRIVTHAPSAQSLGRNDSRDQTTEGWCHKRGSRKDLVAISFDLQKKFRNQFRLNWQVSGDSSVIYMARTFSLKLLKHVLNYTIMDMVNETYDKLTDNTLLQLEILTDSKCLKPPTICILSTIQKKTSRKHSVWLQNPPLDGSNSDKLGIK